MKDINKKINFKCIFKHYKVFTVKTEYAPSIKQIVRCEPINDSCGIQYMNAIVVNGIIVWIGCALKIKDNWKAYRVGVSHVLYVKNDNLCKTLVSVRDCSYINDSSLINSMIKDMKLKRLTRKGNTLSVTFDYNLYNM